MQLLEKIESAQNGDGGWPYQKGGSWTEPTVYALLAGQAAGRVAARETEAAAWLRGGQRADGGWAPRRGVDQSTWVTALVALLDPQTIGAERHARAVAWLCAVDGRETSPLFRWRELVTQGKWNAPPEGAGWPWFPGTAGWVTPTAMAILALRRCAQRQPSPHLTARLESARRFLFARRCAGGGWNHGSARALGYNLDAYPETTGQALVALAGTDPRPLTATFRLAQDFLRAQCPAAGSAWLRLGLLAHQQTPAAARTAPMPCRTLPDAALEVIADAAERGYNVFLD